MDPARDGRGRVSLLLSEVFGTWKRGCWPSRELLEEIQHDVLVLALHERVKPILPVWKAFEHVDKRIKKLRLKWNVNDLIRRTRDMRPSESVLGKTVGEAIAGNAQAQCSLRDMVLEPRKLAESLRHDRQMVIQMCMAQPFVEWLIDIGHPMAKDLHNIVNFLPTVEELKAALRRDKNRKRQQQYRFKAKNSS